MSAENYYQPHVYIDGKLLSESGSVPGLTAVANLSIEWGSTNWWENIDAAQLTLTILDPHGDLLGHASNQPIEIRRDPDNARVFIGSIDSITSTYSTISDPRSGQPRDMWIHEITALDPLGTLQRDRKRGPTYDARDISPYRLHWGPCYMGERKEDISARSPIPIEWEATVLDQYDGATPILIFPVPAFERQQVVSLLTVLRQTARISNVLNRPYYFPSVERIKFVNGTQPISDGTRIGHDGAGRIIITPIAADEPLIPGSRVSIDGGIATGSALREQVTRAEITMRGTRPTSFVVTTEGRYMENVETSYEIGVVPDAPQQMTVQLATDHSSGYWYEEAITPARWDVIFGIAPIYGAPQFEPLTYQFDKHAQAPAWALPWLTPEPPLAADGHPVTYHLVESLTNWVPGVKPFSVVGGTLAYTHKRGWEASLNTAPRGGGGGDRQLGEVATAQTLGNVGDDSLIADWQQIAIVT